MFNDSCQSLCHPASDSKNGFHKTLSGRNHAVELSSCFTEIVFSISAVFFVSDSLLHICSNSSFCHNVLILLSLIRCDKPKTYSLVFVLAYRCLHEVVDSRDGCRHFITEGTFDVPMCLLQQIFSPRTALFSCPFA